MLLNADELAACTVIVNDLFWDDWSPLSNEKWDIASSVFLWQPCGRPAASFYHQGRVNDKNLAGKMVFHPSLW